MQTKVVLILYEPPRYDNLLRIVLSWVVVGRLYIETYYVCN